MPRNRTGNILREGDRFVARILIARNKYLRIRFDPSLTEEQARARAFVLATNEDALTEEIDEQNKRKMTIPAVQQKLLQGAFAIPLSVRTGKPITPRIGGKRGRVIMTDKGNAITHEHLVATMTKKEAMKHVEAHCDGTCGVCYTCVRWRCRWCKKPSLPSYCRSCLKKSHPKMKDPKPIVEVIPWE